MSKNPLSSSCHAESVFDTIHAARAVIACIPAIAISSFNATSVCEILLGVLVACTLFLLAFRHTHHARVPLALAFIWMIYVLASAIYATSAGLPGHHFRTLGKHLPIALGPLMAVAVSTACDRLRLHINTLMTLFLSGLVVGGVLILVRNGPFGIAAPPADFFHTFQQTHVFGRLNSNYAALTCGLSLLGTAGLFCHVIFLERPYTRGAIAALGLLAAVFVALEVVLIVLPSRTALVATTTAFVVFLVSFGRAAIARTHRSKTLISAVIGLVLILAALTVHFLPSVVERMTLIAEANKSGSSIVSGLFGGASANERLQLDALGIHLVAQRPWFGWGPDVSGLIGLFATNPSVKPLTQFHNGYIQDLVSFGVVGALLNAALIVAILMQALRVADAGFGSLSPAYFSVWLAFAAYLLISNLTESILHVKPVAVICAFLLMLICLRGTDGPRNPRTPR